MHRHPQLPWRRGLLLAAVLLLNACNRPPSDPSAAYRAFMATAALTREGNTTDLLEQFDRPTREALTARLKTARDASSGGLPGDAAYLLVLGAGPAPVGEVRTVESQGDRATVEVLGDGGASLGRVTMVREDGRWRVHLDLP